MKKTLKWLADHREALVRDLADLVAIPSISTDGEHAAEVNRAAELTCEHMRRAGLNNVTTLTSGDSYPYAYGEWLGAPGKPTAFLYAHHDVQPINFEEQWQSPPWQLTARDGRLFGRGAADDKGAITAQLGALAAILQTAGALPVNVKMLVEGEEEVGSRNLQAFFQQHKDRLHSDVIVVCDTENVEVGLPCITYALRGIVALKVTVETARLPSHSGMVGGALADAALALNVVLARLYAANRKLPVPGLYDKVRPPTAAERRAAKKLPFDEAKVRADLGMLDGVGWALEKNVNFYEQTSRRPAVTVIAQEASSIKGASNQVLPKASAVVSCRIVPDQDPEEVFEQLKALLIKDPPWGARVTVEPLGKPVKWWMTDPTGPAFEAAMKALKAGYGKKPVAIGCGGTIGFVGPLADLFGGAPALLLGIEDPQSNAHAPNESLHEGDWHHLMASLAHLLNNLGELSDVKAKPAVPAAPEAHPRTHHEAHPRAHPEEHPKTHHEAHPEGPTAP